MASRVLTLFFLGIVGFFGVESALAQSTAPMVEPFTVHGVDVDVTSANVNAAKEQAIADGSRQAFQILLERLTLPKDRARLPKADGRDYVSDYAIDTERASRVRYIATLTVRFNAQSVRKLLRGANIAMIERAAHPVVIVPVYTNGGKTALWDDPNPWRTVWAQPGLTGLVAIAVPFEPPLPTLEQISGADASALTALAVRYHTSDVYVLSLEASGDGHKAVVTVQSAPGAAQPAFDGLTYTAKPGESLDQLLARTARDMARALDAQAKLVQAAPVDGPGDDALWALVSINGLEDWAQIRERLTRGSVVRSWDLLSLTRTEAAIVLHVAAPAERVQAVLAQAGLVLEQGDGTWTLHSAQPKK